MGTFVSRMLKVNADKNVFLSEFFSPRERLSPGRPDFPIFSHNLCRIFGTGEKIKGITMYGQENRIGQFVDNTSLY